MSKKRRSETLNITFVNGLGEGWAFGVVEAFRTNLDIKYDKRIDKEASNAKERLLGRKLTTNEKVVRPIWTQGDPPAYSFARGHAFYDPPSAHLLPWTEALPTLKRSITILDAKPDDGALVQAASLDADDSESSTIIEEVSRSGARGWVDFEILSYLDGQLVERNKTSRSQADFVELLRMGSIEL